MGTTGGGSTNAEEDGGTTATLYVTPASGDCCGAGACVDVRFTNAGDGKAAAGAVDEVDAKDDAVRSGGTTTRGANVLPTGDAMSSASVEDAAGRTRGCFASNEPLDLPKVPARNISLRRSTSGVTVAGAASGVTSGWGAAAGATLDEEMLVMGIR